MAEVVIVDPVHYVEVREGETDWVEVRAEYVVVMVEDFEVMADYFVVRRWHLW